MRMRTLIGIGRVLLWIAMIGWTAFGLWNGVRGTGELLALRNQGRYVNAQVTGFEPLPKDTRIGYVHYAFNAGTRAIDNRFPYPTSRFGEYPIGAPIPVTYLPGQPHIVRMGRVDISRVGTTAISAIVFLFAGIVAFGLPLIALSAGAKKRNTPSVAA